MAVQAHPRAGGENSQAEESLRPRTGSSPHGRGKPTRWRGRLTSPGLIPAWAGKTDRRSRPAWAARTHPRMGGENGAASSCQAPRHGSSPHGRGKRTARARASIAIRAHPRAGGENDESRPAKFSGHGSSPRGREKLRPPGHPGCVGRLIPARAGKTAAHVGMSTPHPAHPRAGGENADA